MEDYANMGLKELATVPGVSDIQPLKARAAFGKALREEAKGNYVEAHRLLDQAVELATN